VNLLGVVLALSAAVGFAASGVLARAGLRGISTFSGTFFSLLGSFAVLFVVALVWDPKALFSVSLAAIPWFVAGGIVNFVLGRMLNYVSLDRIGVARASPLFSLSPFFAIGFAVLFLGEAATPLRLLGTSAIVGGIILIVTDRG